MTKACLVSGAELNKLDDLKPIATGYKVLNWDLTDSASFQYRDLDNPDYSIVGSVWMTNSEDAIELPFYKKPLDGIVGCPLTSRDRYFVVEAYKEVADSDEVSFANSLIFKEEITLGMLIDSFTTSNRAKSNTSNSKVGCSSEIGCRDSIHNSIAVCESECVANSTAVYLSNAVLDSSEVLLSSAITSCEGVLDSEAIRFGWGIGHSRIVNNGVAIYSSQGISQCAFVRHCHMVSYCVLCSSVRNTQFYLFNRPSTSERIQEVMMDLNSFEWKPSFNNFCEVKGNKSWEQLCFPKVCEISNRQAYLSMPKKMLEYIVSMPEFDKEVFKAITEIEVK